MKPHPSPNPWSSSDYNKEEEAEDDKPFLSLAFPTQKDYGLWNSPRQLSNTTAAAAAIPDESWGKATISLDVLSLIPQEVSYPTLDSSSWEDDVSILNDNPEEDDIEVLYLPRSTYDVLVPLFDELFIDEEEKEQDEL